LQNRKDNSKRKKTVITLLNNAGAGHEDVRLHEYKSNRHGYQEIGVYHSLALDKVLPVPLLVGQSYLNSEHNKSFK